MYCSVALIWVLLRLLSHTFIQLSLNESKILECRTTFKQIFATDAYTWSRQRHKTVRANQVHRKKILHSR
jgi:hypothetical protein